MDSEMVFTKEYEIKYYEQNVKGDLKESSLLHFMQDAATLSAESLGFGPSFVFPRNYAWVVLKYHIELYKEIKNFASIVIKTEPRGTTKLYAFRDFEIYSPENELLGKAASAWALIDMESRRMLPIQKVLDFIKPYEKKDDDLEFAKIEPPSSNSSDENNSDIIYQKEFDVRFDDIDVNKHANNCNYIIWALEALPYEFRLEHSPKNIDIKYRKEASMGAKVLSQVQQTIENGIPVTVHIIKDVENDEELTSLKIEWL